MTRKPAVLDQLNIVVHDMEAAVDFYGRFGLEIPDTLPAWQAHHRTPAMSGDVALELDSTAFASQWNAGWPATQPGVVVGLRLATREDVNDLPVPANIDAVDYVVVESKELEESTFVGLLS